MTAGPKARRADAYSSEIGSWLLGDSCHPGGAHLTSRLAGALEVGAGDIVVDVACGSGASALQLIRETGCDVVGVDLSLDDVGEARRAAAGHARFVPGDAESLPFVAESFDGALCECALCLFADAEMAASEIARVLHSGARLALSDLVASPERLPPELRMLLARIACIGEVRPLEGVERLLEGAGFEIERSEYHDAALRELIDGIEATIGAHPLVSASREAVESGALSYGVVIARKP